ADARFIQTSLQPCALKTGMASTNEPCMSEAHITADQTARHSDGRGVAFTTAERVAPAPPGAGRDATAAVQELSDAPRLQPADIGWPHIELRVHSDLAELEREWKALERHADCTVFQSFDWLAKWQRHIGERRGVIPAVVVGREPSGLVLFILQFAI